MNAADTGMIVKRIKRTVHRDKYLYLIFLLPFLYYVLFEYIPMYGIIIAFKDIRVFKGLSSIVDSPWNHLRYFKEYLTDAYFWKLVRNTVLISIYEIVFSFPAPILLALLVNEVRNSAFRRAIQTITYMPHFISTVVVCGMLVSFLASDGIINQAIMALGGKPVPFLNRYQYFRTIFVTSGIWQNVGWKSIVYFAALSAIHPELYEAARIDGANRFRQALHVTLPGIMPTITILLIMAMGGMFSVGYQKIILLYNGITYETADVITTFVYRRGLIDGNFSYAASVNLFSTVIGLLFLVGTNKLCQLMKTTTLW